MNHYRNFLVSFSVVFVLLFCSGWGAGGHRKINEHAPASFPSSMGFLKAAWTVLLAEHGSDADKRKSWDPDEGPRHYIDIDDYPEFVLTGKIPQTYDSVCALHGEAFVINKGILPWATLTAFDTVRECFERMDWNKAGLFAADLGHYIADAHQPLHITRNYDGQYTNQSGIHSRYETKMIGRYLDQIAYPDDTVSFIHDVRGYVFGYLYYNYLYVDSLLQADSAAHALAGSISSDQYYSLFWDEVKVFTTDLFKRSSQSLAALIYTAWIEAGSPVMTPYAIHDFINGNSLILTNTPNPFSSETCIRFYLGNNSRAVLKVYDMSGNIVKMMKDEKMDAGMNEIKWDAGGCRPGVYFITLNTGSEARTVKAILLK